MSGESAVFTRTDGIREEMIKIGQSKITDMLISHMIEVHAVNCEIRHQLKPQDFEGQCAAYITSVAYNGGLDDPNFKSWLSSKDVVDTLTSSYVQTKYKNDQSKEMMENLSWTNPVTSRAKEQLNLQMKLNNLNKTSSNADYGSYGGK